MRSSDWSSDVCSSDLVGEFGGRKMAREFERGHPAHVRPVARVEHIGEGNLLPRARHVERDVIVAREEHQLVAKIIGEQVGTRYRGFEDARAFEAAEGEIMRSEERRVGKSVSVRVALGGRLDLKKKKKKTKTTNPQ